MNTNRITRLALCALPIGAAWAGAPVFAQTAPPSGSYLVYALPSAGASADDNVSPVNDRRSTVTNVADPVASPFGWHDTDGAPGFESTLTSGNNAVVRFTDGTQPDGGPALLFTPALSYPLSNTALNREAAIVNAFYIVNSLHDILYRYGFDEKSGNFQANNYGRGGAGSDAVQVTVEPDGFLGQSNFDCKPDGTSPIMQLGPASSAPISAFQNGVIIHEYGHGLSMRLTGGPQDCRCLENAEQAGEGWADFLALALTTKATDSGSMGRSDLRPGMTYSTDFALNPWTYANFMSMKDHGDYQVGLLWANVLWEVYWGLIDRLGFDPDFHTGTGGNNVALQLVVDGLKAQPCWPGLVDARDAILAADARRYRGTHLCTLWRAFARRGLGFGADQHSPYDKKDGTASFDLPAVCQSDYYMTALTATTPSADSAGVCTLTTSSVDFRVGVWSSGALQPVTLAVAGQPPGVSVSLNPTVVTTPNTESRLEMSGLAGATGGAYSITVTGSGSSTQSARVALDVYDRSPVAPTLTSPAQDATTVPRATQFAWTGETRPHSSYELEVATDESFTNVVRRGSTQAPQYSILGVAGRKHEADQPLEPDTQYYWRVRAINSCGTGSYSATGRFATAGRPWILLVDDDGLNRDVRSYYTAALDAVGLSYDVWDTRFSDVEPNASLLAEYRTVIWFTGDYFGRYAGPAAAGAADIASYLSLGGRGMLMVSAGYPVVHDSEAGPMLRDFFGVRGSGSYLSHDVLTGTGLFAALGSQTLQYGDASLIVPGLTPIVDPSNSVVFTSTGLMSSGVSTAGVTRQTGTYKTSFWGFPFEAVPTPAARTTLLSTALDWMLPKGALGDVNRDGVVSIVDALLIARRTVGLTTEPFDSRVADVSGDGAINVLDALQVARYAAGLCISLPCNQ